MVTQLSNQPPFSVLWTPDLPEHSDGIDVSMDSRPSGHRSRQSFHIALRNSSRESRRGSMEIQLTHPCETEPYILIPGLFYGTGRAGDPLGYPELVSPEAMVANQDPWCSNAWRFKIERASYPLILMKVGRRWVGMDFSPHYEMVPPGAGGGAWIEPQVSVGFEWLKDSVVLSIHLPATEGPRSLNGRSTANPCPATELSLDPGQSCEMDVAGWDFEADSHGYQEPLEFLYRHLQCSHPKAEILEKSLLADSAADGLKHWHWMEDPGYMVYTVPLHRGCEFNANQRGVSLGWHFEATGFVGGFPVAYGLLWHGKARQDNESRRIALKMLDRMVGGATTEFGFFRTSWHPGRARTPNGDFTNPAPVGSQNPDPSGDTPFWGSCWQEDQNIIHARTTADASLFLARCLTKRSLEAAMSVQDERGHFGQKYNLANKSVSQREGDGGLLWIAALSHALDLFEDDPGFLDRIHGSLRSASSAYEKSVRSEKICGAPEDVSLAPSSEDGYNAIMAYSQLYRRYGNPKDLELLKIAADWTLTWRKTFNVRFHPRNILGSYGFKTFGGDFASMRNNHLHFYGLVCIQDLLSLSAWIGNSYYQERVMDHLAFANQILCTVDGQWGGQRGMCDEQFYTTDWSFWGDWNPSSAHVQKGSIFGFSHVWCINMFLLALEQFESWGPRTPGQEVCNNN